MQTYRYRLSFSTPAFVGNASQQAQWRTPPVKALLRQWWRVAMAQELGHNVERLRQREADLFGVAADGGDSHQSLVRIRLGQWSEGKLKSWNGLEQGSIHHPEAEKSRYQVGPHAYLGYGPLDGRGGTQFSKKEGSAIQAGDATTLSVAFVPRRGAMSAETAQQHGRALETALWLMDRYGTLGGRSRNGWGSFSLQPADDGTAPLQGVLPAKPWKEALQLDWPHAIGSDAQGVLVWQTAAFDDWKKLMQELARLKIALRTTQFRFPHDRPDGRVHDRHWLSYPVTTHKVADWDRNNARLPNSLRFKVRPAPQDPKKLVGVVFHVPCKPPPVFQPHLSSIEHVWQTVHAFLDKPEQKLTRIPA